MSEFGIKITNFEAASIYDVNNGTRNKFDSTPAMLVNSLFLDFLMEIGLDVYKGESTRDVICLAFSYGSPSYEEEIAKHNRKIKELMESEEDKSKEVAIQQFMLNNAAENKDKFCKISKNDLRTKYYVDGVTINYNTYDKQGNVIKTEPMHYQMLYRTPGKAKKGTCMFICDRLYPQAHEFLYMGITLPMEKSPIVEIGAYSSLITSSIIGRVQIRPEQMLIFKDGSTKVRTNAIKIKTNENKECYAEEEKDYEIPIALYDGQALIDYELFPDWADGFILLRHHMTKCAAFATNIVQFMKDQFGDDYETATVTDMFGREIKVKDVRFITTDDSLKWLKFKVSVDYWDSWCAKNNYAWGIVKTTHESKFGNVQRTSYQMVNALDINSMPNVVEYSNNHIDKLKSDDGYFLQYLKDNVNFSNDYDVLVALVEHNPNFIYSEYFRERKKAIISAYVLDFKSGRSLQNADNLTIVASPYAMLLSSIGKDFREDPTFEKEPGTIQCWTARFDDGEYLAEFRNPFNSRNNLGYVHNHYHPYMDKYFRLGKLCIAVNNIETDFCPRNNGSDFDSDSCYTTNQPDIVAHAKYCYDNYPTIVNEIALEKNIYSYSLENYAKIDNSLTAAQMAIGQSSNLAQLALTYTYNFKDRKYYDYVCILSVVAQVAIDNAKRKYDIVLEKEIPRIKKDMCVDDNGLPLFWQITKKDKRKAKTDEERKKRQRANREKIKGNLNAKLTCPMNYLYGMDFSKYRSDVPTIPMNEFFINYPLENDRHKSKKVEDLIEKFSLELYNIQTNYDGVNWQEDDVDLLLRTDFNELISEIKQIYISKNYRGMMSWLINRAFFIGSGVKSKKDVIDSNISQNRSILLKILYSVSPNVFLECFKS